MAADSVHHPVTVGADGCLWADGAALEDYPSPGPTVILLPQTWLTWWQFVLDAPFWYRRQRLRR